MHNKRPPHSWWRRRRLLRRVEVTVTDDGCWRLTWRGQGRLPGQGAMAAPPWIGLLFSLGHERSLRRRSRSPDDCRRSSGSRGRMGAPAVRTTAAGTPRCRSRRSAGRLVPSGNLSETVPFLLFFASLVSSPLLMTASSSFSTSMPVLRGMHPFLLFAIFLLFFGHS